MQESQTIEVVRSSPPGAPAVACASAPASVGAWHYLALLLIIVFGGLLRFAYLEHPTLWGDEVATWQRTNGTFQDLLENNRGDGFVPLHYELYWALRQAWPPTPWMMRLPTAIAGILMIPAMYLLARQLVRPRVALMVALMTASSAYMLNYSRDAKMYMECWFFVALHAGCFIWWLRGGGGVAWWGWVAAGCAAVGFHSTAWLVIAVGLVMFLTQGRIGFWRPMAYVLGLAIIGAGPAMFYYGYNSWAERSGGLAPGAIETGGDADRRNSGFAWVADCVRNKTGPQLVSESASAYMVGYSRSEEVIGPDDTVPIPVWILNLAWGFVTGMVLMLLVAAVRWPVRKGTELQGENAGPPPTAWWRVALWVACWVVLPTYGLFYCRSMEMPASPMDWLANAREYVGWNWKWLVPLCLALCWAGARWTWIKWALAWALALAVASVLGWCIKEGGVEWYVNLMDWGGTSAMAGSLVVLGIAVSWAACPARRWQRALGLVLVGAGVLLMCQGGWLVWDVLRQRAEKAGQAHWQPLWMPRYLGIIWPAVALAICIAVSRLPGRPLRWVVFAAVIAANLAQYGARIVLDNEPRIDLVAADIVRGNGNPLVRVYVNGGRGGSSPAMASINGRVGQYYLALGSGVEAPPDRGRGWWANDGVYNRLGSPRTMGQDVQSRPTVKTVVIWEKLGNSQGTSPAVFEAALGPKWKLTDQWEQTIRRHWNWQDIDSLRRLAFTRQDGSVGRP